MKTNIQDIRHWVDVLENIINEPNEVRLIVELWSTHKCWSSYMRDYLMIDLSNGDGLIFDEFCVTADFGDKGRPEPWSGNIAKILTYLSDLNDKGEISEIYLEGF